MQECKGDLWEHWLDHGHLVCISTNGFVKNNGAAVMGRGCALQATRKMPGIQMELGRYLKRMGNVPGILFHGDSPKFQVGILPVKHNWWERADLDLIKQSVDWLAEASLDTLTEHFAILKAAPVAIHVPRLGCGNGARDRDWETEVRPLMESLPDNVVVHS